MNPKKAAHYLFYADPASGRTVTLDQEETHHARSVLRIAPGDTISVTDGAGRVSRCRLERFAGKTAEALVLDSQQHNPPAPALHAVIGLPQKGVFDDALKALAALGVNTVTPLHCRHCGRPWWSTGWEKHVKRFRKTIIAAAKQSMNPHFMRLNDPAPFATALFGAEHAMVFFADENGCALHGTGDCTGTDNVDTTLTCFIGPPGGFAGEEVDALRRNRAIPIRLSEFRLRTELAAVVACGCLINAFRL